MIISEGFANMVNVFDPLTVMNLTLKNRIIMPPMATNFPSSNGLVTKQLIDYYAPRSRGISLVTVEHAYVDRGGRRHTNQLGIHTDDTVSGLKRLAQTIHQSGAAAAIQINHAGGKCSKQVCGIQPVGPSSIKYFTEKMRRLSVAEIKELIEAFVNASSRTIEAGFDAVEVHAAHGFLLNQFTSPLTNQRHDRYGGSLKNRFRFLIEVVKRVREEVGEVYPIFVRLGADDFTLGGLTIDESVQMVSKIVDAGANVLDISGGICGIYHPRNTNPGFFIPMAEAIKNVVSIPVIGVGGITTIQLADQVIREGRVDLIAVGRALLNDPDWGVHAFKSLQNQD